MADRQMEKINWYKVADAAIEANRHMQACFKAGGNVYTEPYKAARKAAFDSIRDHDERNALREAGFELIGDTWCRIEDNQIVSRTQSEAIRAIKGE